MSDEYRFRSQDGLSLFSRVFPGPSANAPVVLCVHGLLRNSRDFEELAPHLAKRFRVIVPDVRGRGFSDRDSNPANYQVMTYIADLMRMLAGLGAPTVQLIGTSMGGIIGMVMSLSQPGVITRLVLNDVGPEVHADGLARIKGYAGRAQPVQNWTEAGEALKGNFGIAWPNIPQSRWADLARRSYRADAAGVLHADADPAIGDVVRNSPTAVPDLWPLWGQLGAVPILTLRGEISDVLSQATLERMQREKPGMAAVIVRNRGHVPLLDEPEALAAIDGFLKD